MALVTFGLPANLFRNYVEQHGAVFNLRGAQVNMGALSLYRPNQAVDSGHAIIK